jgi:hypothetical protein
MGDIGPGTELEFIGPDELNGNQSGLMLGAVYVVREIIDPGDFCLICMRSWVNLDVGPFPYVYCPCLFRPIRDGQERIERKAVKRVCEPA